MKDDILRRLDALSDCKYQEFSQKLSPGISLIGVRLPELRKLGRALIKEYGYKLLDYSLNQDSYFEEKFIKAYAIGGLRLELHERFSHIKEFLPFIDGWAINDSFCTMLKSCRDFPDEYYSFIEPMFMSEHTFTVRFALVMCINYYVKTDYADRILKKLDKICTEDYYVHMAVAWLIASIYTFNDKEKTLSWLMASELDNRTFNKSLTKMTESLTTAKDEKAYLKTLKRKA